MRRGLPVSALLALVFLGACSSGGGGQQITTVTNAKTTAEADQKIFEQLRAAGADLTKPRTLNHYLYFPSEEAARSAAERLRLLGYTVDVHVSPKPTPGQAWSVVATKVTVVNPETIKPGGAIVGSVAAKGRGVYDGWEPAATP